MSSDAPSSPRSSRTPARKASAPIFSIISSEAHQYQETVKDLLHKIGVKLEEAGVTTTPARMAKLFALAYDDAIKNDWQLREDLIRRYVDLVK